VLLNYKRMKMRKTKILCTIGPATSSVAQLKELIEAGMDAARINFSHGTHKSHKELINNIRMASEELKKPVFILGDLQGPKIRTGKVESGAVELINGSEFIITSDDMEFGTSTRVGTTYKNLIKEVKPGKTLLLDDGYIILDITDVTNNEIITKVRKGGKLKDNKGIIAPGMPSNAPSLSKKDIEDLKFGLKNGVDGIALSFVRSIRDVLELKSAMLILGKTLPVVAKIERAEGFHEIENIIKEVDMVMVARGDLGLEMPTEEVPVLQKEIISKCNYFGTPVITATQMLESMINNPRPTRAEASDVANAVLDGTDVVMLSGETSIGKYPFDAVEYMSRIISSVESKYPDKTTNFDKRIADSNEHSDAIGRASCSIAEQIGASAIVAYTGSSFTAKNISKYRPKVPIKLPLPLGEGWGEGQKTYYFRLFTQALKLVATEILNSYQTYNMNGD
jgi:pyruvate kinase